MNVVGTSGSGKSIFAKELKAVLGHPLIDIDGLHWGPDWTPASPAVLRERLREALTAERWILDGNYGGYTDTKWERVTHVVWLDYPYLQVIWQIFWRSIDRALRKTDLWGTGNRETLKQSFFSKDSIILWAMQTHFDNRRKYLSRMKADEYAHIEFIRLRSRKEAAAFLARLEARSVTNHV